MAAQKAHLDKISDMISAAGSPQGGTAAFIIPSLETCTALGVTKRGNVRQELVDYIGKAVYNEFLSMGAYLNRRKIFKSVAIIEDNYPVPAAKKTITAYDAVIYMDLAAPDQRQWFLRAAPEYKITPVNSDKSKEAGLPRMISWLDDIETHLRESGYQPKK